MKKEKAPKKMETVKDEKVIKKEEKITKIVDKKKVVSKENDKKKEKSKDKVGFFKKIKNFFQAVIKEVKHVSWPTKKDMVNYSVATVAFILFFGIFFYIIELVMAFLRTLV